jgi:hypothetical protein
MPRAPALGWRWPLLVALALVTVAAGGFALQARSRHGARVASRLPAAATGVTQSLNQGLVGYWRFDDGAGSPVARDRSGHGTNCRLNGMSPRSSWSDGPLGGALTFGGLGWLNCPQPQIAAGTSNLTVALWVKRTEHQPGYHVLVTRQIGDSNLDYFYVGFRGDDILLASHAWGGKLAYRAPPVGRWFHLGMVHARGEVVLFLDGVAVMRRPATDEQSMTGDTALTVGGGVNGADKTDARQRFIGAVDELAVFDRALSAAEMTALAAGTQPTAR